VLRYGLRPSKIAFLAEQAWADAEAGAWPPGFPACGPLRLRPRRDRALAARVPDALLRLRQFKRTAIPNGPKVLPAGSLSPRGDWRAPSDGNAAVWLAELDAALPDLITVTRDRHRPRSEDSGGGSSPTASVMIQPSGRHPSGRNFMLRSRNHPC
jgi:hypothetical protein